jgi:hypothetical protein
MILPLFRATATATRQAPLATTSPVPSGTAHIGDWEPTTAAGNIHTTEFASPPAPSLTGDAAPGKSKETPQLGLHLSAVLPCL